ncbi:hypothetical protein SCUCBS95973_003600 [Sporothrix curviconia]|uniref:Ankyrin repeat protein n=1 Tax=Sporothrix curviconia TaxID=1260050 RepID=A0ABP0BHV0_9PEZI
MDPLSIATNVVGITAFCAKLIQGIGRFVIEAREVPDTLSRFYNTIQNLQTALLGVERALRQRPEQLPFERDHHQNISRIIRSCQSVLGRLDGLLPDLEEDPGAYYRVRASLLLSVKKNVVQQYTTHIESYTQVLQLSLTTISLGSLWKTQQSQVQIHAAIRSLTDSIRSANLLPPSPSPHDLPGSAQTVLRGMEEDSSEAISAQQKVNTEAGSDQAADESTETSLADEIIAWQQSATEMVEVLSLYEPDQMPRVLATGDTGAAEQYLASDSGIGGMFDDGSVDEYGNATREDSSFDPEPKLRDCPSREIIQINLEQNQKIVAQFVRCGIFTKAALYQRKAIGYKTQLAEAYQIPFTHDDEAGMKEFLAQCLLDTETRVGCAEARDIFQTLLQAEVARPSDEVDQQRRCRLYQTLGTIHLNQGNTALARRFLGRAFEGRKSDEATPSELVLESVDQLVKALQLDQAFDEARGYLEWRHRHFPAPAPLLPLQSQRQPIVPSNASPSPPMPAPHLPQRPPILETMPYRLSQAGGACVQEYVPVTTEPAVAAAAESDVAAHVAPSLSGLTVQAPLSQPNIDEASPARVLTRTPEVAPMTGAAGLSNAFAWCIEKKFDVDDPSFRFEVYDSGQNTSPLHLALHEENIELVRQMLAHAVDLEHRDAKFCTPLLVAAGTRNRETTRLLLERGAKVDVRDMSSQSALHRCQSRSGGVQVAKLLLQYLPPSGLRRRRQSSVSPGGCTVMEVVAPPASPAAATPWPLSSGDSKPHMIDATDSTGRTAFFVAMDNGNYKMARFLLSQGADPDINDVFGKTALYMVCERGDEVMARCALVHGAFVDARGPGLRTPLIAAIETAVPANSILLI